MIKSIHSKGFLFIKRRDVLGRAVTPPGNGAAAGWVGRVDRPEPAARIEPVDSGGASGVRGMPDGG